MATTWCCGREYTSKGKAYKKHVDKARKGDFSLCIKCRHCGEIFKSNTVKNNHEKFHCPEKHTKSVDTRAITLLQKLDARCQKLEDAVDSQASVIRLLSAQVQEHTKTI